MAERNKRPKNSIMIQPQRGRLIIAGPGMSKREALRSLRRDERLAGREALQFCHDRLDQGDDTAILEGIFFCCLFRVSVSERLRQAYMAQYLALKDADWSLNKVFGKSGLGKPGRGRQREFLRREVELVPRVFDRVEGLANQIPSKIKRFEKVGAEFGISASTCKKYYYLAVSTKISVKE